MAVDRIEEYKQLNGVSILKVYCKPTQLFPSGSYFYAPAEARKLVETYGWRTHYNYNAIYVIARDKEKSNIRFHSRLYEFYHGKECLISIDHHNHVGYDNTDNNLDVVLPNQNAYNRFSKGYSYINSKIRVPYFQATIKVNASAKNCFGLTRREDEVCIKQNYVEQVWLKEKLGDDYYMFDFFTYRYGSEDILDLERTGKISETEATYRHILRYSDNAWYYLRYNLEEYFKDNHIPVPKYDLDEQGYMIDIITRKRLCPFN